MKARILILTAFLFAHSSMVRAQGTAFTYQGKLNLNAAAANGNFDFQFGLYTNLTGGNLTGTLVTNTDTGVSNGLFTTTLNFGSVFNGTPYWLEIGVRTNGSTGAFSILSPRQELTPAPYAITANSASNLLGTVSPSQLSGPLPASLLTGIYSNMVSFTNSANVFSGNGSGLTGLLTPNQTNFLFVMDTNVQLVVSPDTFQTITFSLQQANGGWGTSTGGIFTAPQSGLYLVQYQVEVQNGLTSYSTVQGPNIAFGVRGVLNSTTEITGSESIIIIPPAFGAGILSRSFLLPITAGQTLSLQITANSSGSAAYIASGSFAGENYPGVTLTIIRIQ